MAWSRLVSIQSTTSLRTIHHEIPEPKRPKTPTEFDVSNRVLVDSSPPDATILQTANKLLN